MRRIPLRRGAAIAGLAAVAGLAACDIERATVLEPIGEPAYNFQLVLAPAGLPGGTASWRRPATVADQATQDSLVRIIVAGLDSLSGNNVYKVWLGSIDAAGTVAGWVPVTGTLITTRGTVVDTVASGGTFVGGATGYTLLIPQTASFDPFNYNTALITIETDANATTPSDYAQPLWARRAATTTTAGGVTAATSNLLFGNFAPLQANAYVYTPLGRGLASIRGSRVVTVDTALARPPAGYYYAAWLVKPATDSTAGDTISLGELRTPDLARSLREADTALVSPVVQENPPIILEARTFTDVDTLPGFGNLDQPFLGFNRLLVTLQNKFAPAQLRGSAVILVGTVPDIVVLGPEGID